MSITASACYGTGKSLADAISGEVIVIVTDL
jgi:hypothetical protein